MVFVGFFLSLVVIALGSNCDELNVKLKTSNYIKVIISIGKLFFFLCFQLNQQGL